MGLFRFFLAIAVVMAHAKSVFSSTNLDTWQSVISKDKIHIYLLSGHAVFAFFIISGFFMSMIINEKYSKLKNGNVKFYLNRALRLYPANLTVIVIALLFFATSGVASFMTFSLPQQSMWLTIAAWFSNLFFFGAELIPFFNSGNWPYVSPQIWSLSVELYFYLIAPLIVCRSFKLVLALTVAAFLFRFSLFYFDVPITPWRYFFFPSVFIFFMLGVLAHKTKDITLNVLSVDVIFVVRALATVFVGSCVFWRDFWAISGEHDALTSWIFYISIALSTPLIFKITKKNSIDAYFGNLSYPVYISHSFVIVVVYHLVKESSDRGLVAMVATLLLSVMIHGFIDSPIQKIRAKIVSKQ